MKKLALVLILVTARAAIAAPFDLAARAGVAPAAKRSASGLAATPRSPPPDRVTLDDALALLRDRSATTRARHAQVDVAVADLVGAGLLPNPSFSLSEGRTIAGDTAGSVNAVSAELDWPILIGGQRRARRAAAASAIDASRAEVASADWDAALAVRHAFVTLLAAQARVEERQTALEDIRRIQDIIAARAKAGAQSDYDRARVALEVASAEKDVAEARAAADGAAGDLATAVGIPGWHPIALGTLAPDGYQPDLSKFDAGAVPSVRAAGADEVAAEAAVEAARHEGVPTPSLVLGVLETNDPHGWGATIGVQVPLPIYDRGQGQVAHAQAAARQADLTLDAQRDAARSRVESTAIVLADRRAALSQYDDSAAAHLDELRKMAEDAYTQGAGDITQLLDALGAISSARLGRIDLVEEVVHAEIDARAAAGQ